MALEVATKISDLVVTNPVSGDPVSQADDHLRLIKTAIKGTPLVIDRAYGEYTTNADLSGAIPLDDTIPQNTEGTQIISVSLTPKATTSRVRLRFEGSVIASTTINAMGAIFTSASANALVATCVSTPGNGFNIPLVMEHEYVPGSTSAITFTVRVGSQGGATFRMNGGTAGRLFGGAMKATLVVEEIQT